MIPVLIDPAACKTAVQALKDYLDDIGYHGIYKYLTAVNWYYVSPSMFNESRRVFQGCFDKYLAAEKADWKLAQILTTQQPLPFQDLNTREQKVAELLIEAELARLENGYVAPARRQLISVRERYLLLDASIHYSTGRVHDVYIGPDTYMLLHYLNGNRLGQGCRALDLCTGTGVIGLVLAKYCGSVISTDIEPAPLEMAGLNRLLNGAEAQIEIREQDMRETLSDPDRFDLVVCNPPFVASPPGLPSPPYAEGGGADGLGYLRLLMDRAPEKLTDNGEALFVADLPGDAGQPYYFEELEKAARERGLFVEAYIDNRLEGSRQIAPFVSFLSRVHTGLGAAEIEDRVKRFIREDLRAFYYYLTTIRVRRRGRAGLRVLNRYRITDFDAFFFSNS